MADIEHKNIADANLHEPKGVVSAVANKVYLSDGAASGAWSDAKVAGQATASADEIAFSDGGGSTVWGTGRTGGSLIMLASDYTNQYPSALDTPLLVTYGGAQTTTEFNLSAAGALTCNVTGWYRLLFNMRFGRTAGTGTAQILWRTLLNGTQIGNTIAASIAGATDAFPYSLAAGLQLTATDVLTFEVIRDSSGNNDGGLQAFIPALGSWGSAVSASLRIDKEFVTP